jgi:hypothetical protein
VTTAGDTPAEVQRLTGMNTLAVRALYRLARIAGTLAGLALTYPSLSLAVGAALACGSIAQRLDRCSESPRGEASHV